MKKTVAISKANVIRETEKAYLVRCGLLYKKIGVRAEVWIAKSQCSTTDESIIAPIWMFQKSAAAENMLRAYQARHKAYLIKVCSYDATL